MSTSPLLEVRDLKVSFRTDDGLVEAVDGISYSLEQGRTLGIVGESGSGKTVSGLTLLGLTGSRRTEISGEALFEGTDLLALDEQHLRKVRGQGIAMIFQDPLSSLHPFYRVGAQIIEAIRAHQKVSKSAARARAIELLGMVGIPDPAGRVDAFPHEFSGGMRQRAMIAMALSNEPRLLIADEPTTALDVTVQAQILELLDRLQQQLGMAMIIITHDLGVVAETADQVAVMYGGRIIEQAESRELFDNPQHPYTWGLLRSVPRIDGGSGERLRPIPGRPPSLIGLPEGCAFAPRCLLAHDACLRAKPRLESAGSDGHTAACVVGPTHRAKAWHATQQDLDDSAIQTAAGVSK
ncbi:MAG: ABC transporter ATP-binding protein [Solirubrobacterales bacterium]|nr:ABC transporter ATP-binding protein [Solirubrobacterales bacterium]